MSLRRSALVGEHSETRRAGNCFRKKILPFTVEIKRNKIFVKTAQVELQFVYDDKTDSFTGPDKARLNKVSKTPLPAAPP